MKCVPVHQSRQVYNARLTSNLSTWHPLSTWALAICECLRIMSKHVSLAILFAVLALVQGVHDDGGSDLHAKYSFSVVLNHDNPSYILHWSVNLNTKEVSFAINSSSQGWVGLGLSKTGQMIGSDVVTAWIDDNGEPQLQVRAEL